MSKIQIIDSHPFPLLHPQPLLPQLPQPPQQSKIRIKKIQLLSHPQLLFEQEQPPFPIPGHPPLQLHCDEQGLPHSVADKSLIKSLHFFLTLYPM